MAKKRNRPLVRTANVVRDANLVVIACEDKYAVKQYFDFFRSTRVQVHVLPTAEDGKSAPQHVLARLNEYIDEHQIGPDDQFWLVCDCDHWIGPGHIQNLTAVLSQCRQQGIRFAVCRPCFELWLLLHFADFPTEPLPDCDTVGELIRTAVGSYNKTRVDQLPITFDAVRNALRRAGQQASNQDIPTQPQTRMNLLVQELLDQRAIVLSDETGA